MGVTARDRPLRDADLPGARGAWASGRSQRRLAGADPGVAAGHPRRGQEPREPVRGRGPRVLAVGGRIPLPSGPRRRPAPIPVDLSRSLEQLLGAVPFDVVHVHEPFAPSPGSAALRHSVSLNVASFHEPAERVLSTQVARPRGHVLRPHRRPHREQRGNRRDVGALLPGPYELSAPRRRCRGTGAAPAAGPAADRPRGGGGAGGAPGLPPRPPPPSSRSSTGRRWSGSTGRPDPLARVSRRLRERLRLVRPAATGSPRPSSPVPTSSASPPAGCGSPPRRPARRSPPGPCRSSPTSSSTASWSATASAGCCSRSGTR